MLYLVGEPRDAVLSIFRRDYQIGHFRSLNGTEPDADARRRLESLETFLAAGVDDFALTDHLEGWLEHPEGYPVLFVRYEWLSESWSEIAAFVGLPADSPPLPARGAGAIGWRSPRRCRSSWRRSTAPSQPASTPFLRRSSCEAGVSALTPRELPSCVPERRHSEDEQPVNQRLPDNLELLYSAFSKEAIDGIFPGDSFVIDDVEFVCKYMPDSTAQRFFIVKPLELVDQYRELCERFAGGAIFELGIAEGGSTALLALLAQPNRLIAVDLEPQPLDALAEFAAAHQLSEVVRPYYGVDQGDRARLTEIVDSELGDTPLDLVFDDASHQLDLTRSSFETLFPRLRPGGLFVIDDWRADHIMRDAVIAQLRNPSAPGTPKRPRVCASRSPPRSAVSTRSPIRR